MGAFDSDRRPVGNRAFADLRAGRRLGLRGGAAVPLVVAAFVWWVRWMREERAKGPEAAGWGMGVAAFLFVAAMAVGAGAIVGGLAQLGCGYVVTHFTLTATPGMWLGALAALFFWGLGQQPKRLAAPAS